MISGIFLALLGGLAFLLVLSFLVFFHELGHYSVARFFNVAVERFSIGFGKPIWERTARSGTQWRVSAIPLGGYVKFLGDAGAASNPDLEKLAQIKRDVEQTHGQNVAENCFHFKPLWQRALVVLAGPMANFLLALVIYAGFAWFVGMANHKAVVGELTPDFPAQQAGFQAGDEILKMNGEDASTVNQIMRIVRLRTGTPIETQIKRGDEILTLTVTPRRVIEDDFIGGDSSHGKIGMGFDPNPELTVSEKYGFLGGLGFGMSEIGDNIAMTGYYVGRIFTGREDGTALGGPAKIAALTSQVAVQAATADVPLINRIKGGALNMLSLAAALSIGLGIANLMPIPVLDGGHLVYYGYEAIAGRPLSERKQELGFRFGLSLLLGLLVILTWNDIGYVRSLFS